jgi:hypothetical protein
MIGLLLKDVLNLKKYVKQISLSVVVFGIFAVQLKTPAYLIGMMSMMCSMLVITSMSYDESTKWDKYALTMPILKKDIVLSKYILLVSLVAVGTVFSGIISMIMSEIMQLQEPIVILLISGAVALVMLLIFSVLMPLLLKYGVEKARILIFAIVGLPVLAVTAFVKLVQRLKIPKPDEAQLEKLFEILPYALPVIVLAVLFLSYHLSVRIYNNKEM